MKKKGYKRNEHGMALFYQLPITHIVFRKGFGSWKKQTHKAG